MYLRSVVTRRGGRTYRYWRLVESIRTPEGVRQRIVAHLGDLSHFRAEDWQRLAERMGEPRMARALAERVKTPRRGRPRGSLIWEDSRPQETVTIQLKHVGWERPRSFGDVYVALHMWKRLGLSGLLNELLGRDGKTDVPPAVVAAIIATNRLVEPESELGITRWYGRTALPELLGISPKKIHKDRLYRTLSDVVTHKEAIERHLADKGESLFGQKYTVLVYDLTSTYFEGQAKENPKAQRGYSRDYRPDAKQIALAVVVNEEGFPLGYEVLEGNIRDHETLGGLLEKLEKRFGENPEWEVGDEEEQRRRIISIDRGLITEENLRKLKEKRYGYVVAQRRFEASKFWSESKPDGWMPVEEKRVGESVVEVQEIEPEGGDRLFLIRSRGCRQKERAIHDRFLTRLVSDLERLAVRVEGGRLKDPVKIERAIGGLRARHKGMWRWVEVEHRRQNECSALVWRIKSDVEERARQMEGVYLLRSNLKRKTPNDVWRCYLNLVRVEEVFRTLKHDLVIRPVFHRIEERVEAHVLFSYLAYVMYWVLERQHRARGGELTGRRILEELKGIQLGTIRLRTVGGQVLLFKRVSRPEREQAYLLASLGVGIPPSFSEPERVTLTL